MAQGTADGDVDWHSVPGRPGWYRPDIIAPNLHTLATATSTIQAAHAATALASGGIVHEHSGGLMPAAALAAPILLNIIEHGHPAAREAASELLSDSLTFAPYTGYTRAPTPIAAALPICCAIAHHIHLRNPPQKTLLAAADQHWLYHVDDLTPDTDHTGITTSGTVHGRLPLGRHEAEYHTPTGYTPVWATIIEPPTTRNHPTASLRLQATGPLRVMVGAVIVSADHGRRAH